MRHHTIWRKRWRNTIWSLEREIGAGEIRSLAKKEEFIIMQQLYGTYSSRWKLRRGKREITKVVKLTSHCMYRISFCPVPCLDYSHILIYHNFLLTWTTTIASFMYNQDYFSSDYLFIQSPENYIFLDHDEANFCSLHHQPEMIMHTSLLASTEE